MRCLHCNKEVPDSDTCEHALSVAAKPARSVTSPYWRQYDFSVIDSVIEGYGSGAVSNARVQTWKEAFGTFGTGTTFTKDASWHVVYDDGDIVLMAIASGRHKLTMMALIKEES